MTAEEDDRLCAKYPKIFKDRHGDKRITCMCWGFDCGSGWYWLIDNLCDCIQRHIDANDIPQVVAAQVKQKYGTLIFACDGGDKLTEGMIWLAEYLSGSICEDCGSTESVYRNKKGYIQTVCRKCRESKV